MKQNRLGQIGGFTLVEMLIVIVIIGILAAALIPKLTGSLASARDVERVKNLSDIGIALSLYNADNGQYPLSGGAFVDTLGDLVDGGYINSLPKDRQATNQVKGVSTAGQPDCQVGYTPGEYVYTRLGNNNFALVSNPEAPKKSNRVLEAGAGTTGDVAQGCLGSNLTLKQVIGAMCDGIVTTTTTATDTNGPTCAVNTNNDNGMYIYAN